MGGSFLHDRSGIQPNPSYFYFGQSLRIVGNRMYGNVFSFFVLREDDAASVNGLYSDSVSATKSNNLCEF
jgi:hypothetical protein